ncbi:MAG: hypothetical protein ACR2F2_10190 [Pyrinomonadaceae bacterium]
MDIHSKSTFLSEFQPKNLAKHLQKNDWIFAEYYEKPEQRIDKKSYRAFLFRSKDRTIFGVKEFWDEPSIDFRKLANRVVSEKVFRDNLISDDEDLRKIWKRH